MSNLVMGRTGEWEVVIGMEVHAQVSSNSKLFSGAPTAFGADPNQNVSLVDAAMPGMLPVINEECVHQAIRTGLGLNAEINCYSVFDRKNYFYADLPQGYQISQFKHPIVGEGAITIDLKKVALLRLLNAFILNKMLVNPCMTSTRQNHIDLNRSDVALMKSSQKQISVLLNKLVPI